MDLHADMCILSFGNSRSCPDGAGRFGALPGALAPDLNTQDRQTPVGTAEKACFIQS
jgi:hypothetical protein